MELPSIKELFANSDKLPLWAHIKKTSIQAYTYNNIGTSCGELHIHNGYIHTISLHVISW